MYRVGSRVIRSYRKYWRRSMLGPEEKFLSVSDMAHVILDMVGAVGSKIRA